MDARFAAHWFPRVIDWLRSIGLEVDVLKSLAVAKPQPESFLTGVWLDQGRIIIDTGVAHIGDVLHEAGHLACIHSCFRSLVEPGTLPGPKLMTAITGYCDTHLALAIDDIGTEDPVWRSILQMGDCEATAWSYAAAKALDLNAVVLFETRADGLDPYNGSGHDIWAMLDANSYFGINGLQAAGFCTVKTFPAMKRWLAP